MDKRWCSFVHLIPWFGKWFESRYGFYCMLHDTERATETNRRGLGEPPLWPPGTCDWRFLKRIATHGALFDVVVAVLAYLAVVIFYWPNRWRKFLTGEVDHV